MVSSVCNLLECPGLRKLPHPPPAREGGKVPASGCKCEGQERHLSQLSEITARENNRVRGLSVKRWLANTRGIFPRSVQQHVQRRTLNMGLIAKRDNPVRQR